MIRKLPLAGVYNTRDLGGYTGIDGSQVAYGKLFRADALGHLTDEDLALLASIPITTVVDFRSGQEKERLPDKLPGSVMQYLEFPVQPGGIDLHTKGLNLGTDGGLAFMHKVNRELVLDEGINRHYRDFFAAIQNQSQLPLLFHCSAGKDRTGLAAALILLSLGVAEEDVFKDYMASADFLTGKYDHIIRLHPEMAELFTVRPEFLTTALDAIHEKYGSVERYLTDVLDVDLAKMHALFLEKK